MKRILEAALNIAGLAMIGAGLTIIAGVLAVACRPTPAGPAGSGLTIEAAPTVDITAPYQTRLYDGTYDVSADIPAGTWQTQGPTEGHTCRFTRHNQTPTGNTQTTVGPYSIVLNPGERFTTAGCQPWTPKQ